MFATLLTLISARSGGSCKTVTNSSAETTKDKKGCSSQRGLVISSVQPWSDAKEGVAFLESAWTHSLLSLVSLEVGSNDYSVFGTPGVKTDRALYRKPALPVRPRAGGKFLDPVFGTEIMRATDESDGGAPGLGTYYSHWPTFNADNTKILIRKGVNGEAILKDFDAVNFQLGATHTLPTLPDGTSVAWQGAIWSNTDPNIIYCHPGWNGANYPDSGMKLYRYDVRVRTSAGYKLIKDLGSLAPRQPDFLGQMYMSADDDTFCWLHFRISGGNGIVWGYTVYRRSTNMMLDVPNTFVGGIDEVHIDRTGRYLEIKLNQNQADGSRTRIFDLQTKVMQVLMVNAQDKPTGHGDNGYGTMVGFDAWAAGIHVRKYNDIHHPKVQFVFSTSNGTLDWTLDFHLSMNATDQNWATVGTYYNPGSTTLPHSGVFSDEIFQVALDGSGRFRRLCHTRSAIDNLTATTGYWAVPKPNISKDGRFIAYTSNWEKSGRYDLFIAKVDPPVPTPMRAPSTAPATTRRRRIS